MGDGGKGRARHPEKVRFAFKATRVAPIKGAATRYSFGEGWEREDRRQGVLRARVARKLIDGMAAVDDGLRYPRMGRAGVLFCSRVWGGRARRCRWRRGFAVR